MSTKVLLAFAVGFGAACGLCGEGQGEVSEAAERVEVVRALLERSRLLEEARFRVARSVYEEFVRAAVVPARPVPAPVGAIAEEGAYAFVLPAGRKPLLLASLRLHVFNPEQCAGPPVLSAAWAWEDVRVDGAPAHLATDKGWLRLSPGAAGQWVVSARLALREAIGDAGTLDLAVVRTVRTHVAFESPEPWEVSVRGAVRSLRGGADETRGGLSLPPTERLRIAYGLVLPATERPPRFALRGDVAWNLDAGMQQVTSELDVAIAGGAAEALELSLPSAAEQLSISGPDVREVRLKAPPDTSVLSVAGANVQDWRLGPQGDLTVAFRSEVIGAAQLHISFERVVKDSAEAPVIRAVGVEREKGFIGVFAVTNVEIGPGDKVAGARQIDVRQLPAEFVAMTKQPILLGFRYVGEQVSIPLTVKRHEEVGVLVTIVDSALFTAMQLNDGRRITKVVYTVRNNRNQFLRLKLPKGAEVWSVEVGGNTASPARDEQGNVLLPLIRSGGGAQEMASFPVDIVYVEAPATAAPRRGTLRVELPRVDAPAMHIMFNYYLPPEGRYTVGLFGWSGFSGPLRVVDDFTALAAGPERVVVVHDAERQAQQMEQQVQQRVEREARAAGVEPIRVRLPIQGKLFKLEKLLALPQDALWFEVAYRGWEPAK